MSQMAFAPAQKLVQSAPASSRGVLQRKCDNCRKKKPLLQRATIHPGPDSVPPIVHDVLRSPGQPLDKSARTFMEPRFGHDFSRIRVHTDTKAALSAQAIHALAYTMGHEIVFGESQYAPTTIEGKKLIAHELAHAALGGRSTNAGELKLGKSDDIYEQEANRQAASVMEDVSFSRPSIMGTARARTLPEISGNQVRRSLKGGIIGGLSGLLAGALVGGLVGGPLGLLIGAGVGLIGGALLGHALTGKPSSKEKTSMQPAPTHLEINASNVPLVSDPMNPQESGDRLLPEGTRVVIINDGQGEPFNRDGGQWVEIRVTTGPDMDSRGWVLRSQLVSRPETTEISMEGAIQLFGELAQAKFITTQDAQAPIPFHYPIDGCYARAHSMADILTEKGYASEKVFAVSRVSTPGGGVRGGLRVPTEYAGDVPLGSQPAVEWWYHVAPIIKVRIPQAGLIDMVIDPSLASAPLTINQWTGMMRNEAFAQMKLADVRDMLRPAKDNTQWTSLSPSQHLEAPILRPETSRVRVQVLPIQRLAGR